MIFTGIFILLSVALLKKIHTPNHLFLKFFIIAFILPNFDYAINIIALFMDLSFKSSIFHSFFLVTLISALFYACSEYKKSSKYKILSKAFFLGFSMHLLISFILSLDPLNYFWPIPDKDLEFSLMHKVLSQNTDKFMLFFSLFEFCSFIFYGKFLTLRLLKNNSSASELQRVQRFLKIEKNLFIILLIIFFVIYFMNIFPISLFLMTFSICYLFILSSNIYLTCKINFKLI